MVVRVISKQSGEATLGKFAVIEANSVGLFSGIMSDKKGGFRGCGRKQTFPAAEVTVEADEPSKELRSK